MLDLLSGADAQLSIPFGPMVDDPIIADQDSVRYTLRDHSGAAVSGHTGVAVTTGPTSWQVSITIPAAQNTIAVGKSFERRSVQLDFTVNGTSRLVSFPYRLIPFLNHTVDAQRVRSFMGVNANELPDEDIDVFAAYLRVQNDLGEAELNSALSAGTTVELAANTCIAMQVVLDVLPSLRTRIAQKESNGVMGFERPEIRDFREVEKAARDAYSGARQEALGLTETSPTYVVVTQDADPITG